MNNVSGRTIMNILKFDIKKHSLHTVSRLIFESDPKMLRLLFGLNEKKSIKNISKVVKSGNNPLSHDNIHIVVEKNEIIGLVIAYKTNSFSKNNDFKELINLFSLLDLIRMFLIKKLIFDRVKKNNFSSDDFIINNICVDPKFRRKGIGSKILNYAIEQSKIKRCKNIKLNISSDNKDSINFFKKNNFKIYDENKIWLILSILRIYLMQYEKI